LQTTQEITVKKVVYVDMDNVIVDFESGVNRLTSEQRTSYADRLDEVPGIFALMDPIEDAVASVRTLCAKFDVYILSTAPWANPSAWSDKVEWIHRHFGSHEDTHLYKRLILTHHKNLNEGDFLIDDRTKNGADRFNGIHIHFGQPSWPNWKTVVEYLMDL
jgi:5'(3')-deoxyribonucleotidase